MRRAFFVLFLSGVLLECSAQAQSPEEAKTLFKAGKWEEAFKSYEQVLPRLDGDAKADVLLDMGYCLQRKHRHKDAIPLFHRILQLKRISGDRIASAYLKIGYSLRLLGEDEEALEPLRKVSNFKAPPDTIGGSLLYLGWALVKLNRIDEAREAFRRIQSLEGVLADYIATTLINLGRLDQRENKYKEAIGFYKQALKLSPISPTKLARARTYIAECEALLAGDNPFHIKPYICKLSSSSARVFWVSQGNAPAGTVLLRDGKMKLKALATSTPIPNTECYLQIASFDKLSPGTIYRYRVTCGKKQFKGSFKTPPVEVVPFKFCTIGDTQSYNKSLQPLLDSLARENPDFVLHMGDITDRGTAWGEWKASFFDPDWCYLRKAPLFPAFGNHDGGPFFAILFDLRKRYYSFDYSNAHFIALDSYGAGTGRVGRKKQLEWLEKDLAQSKALWKILWLHVPMVATRRELRWFGEEDFLPLLEKYGVDIVFSGHHPLYRRYLPIGEKGKKPIFHITTGGGGGPVGGSVPSPLLVNAININHFAIVKINGNRLQPTQRQSTGES